MIRVFGLFYGIPARFIQAVQDLLNPKVLYRVLNLGREEMKHVKEADHETISKNIDKLWFYYGANDGWTPVKYYENMISKHSDLNAQLCQRGFQHSFVLKDDVDMGHIVGDLINEDLKHWLSIWIAFNIIHFNFLVIFLDMGVCSCFFLSFFLYYIFNVITYLTLYTHCYYFTWWFTRGFFIQGCMIGGFFIQGYIKNFFLITSSRKRNII